MSENFAEMPKVDYTKSCTNCTKVNVCKFYSMYSQFKEGFEAQSEGKVIIPLAVNGLAITCHEFDAIAKEEDADEGWQNGEDIVH